VKQLGPVRFVMLACAGAALLAASCTGGGKDVRGAKVKGQLVQSGQPFKFLPQEEIIVSFTEEKGGKDAIGSYAVVSPETGTFTIEGPTRHGIPAGKYRVSLSSQIYGGDGTNRFEATFDGDKTPLVADVGAEEGQTFVIDVAQKTVQKQ